MFDKLDLDDLMELLMKKTTEYLELMQQKTPDAIKLRDLKTELDDLHLIIFQRKSLS